MILRQKELLTDATAAGEEALSIYNTQANGGSIADAGVTMYAYDSMNHLTQVQTDNNILATYTYDGTGMRVAKTQNNVTQKYYWDRGYVANESIDGIMTATNYLGVDGIFARNTGTGMEFLFKNGHGDVVHTRKNGQEVAGYDYDAYGVQTAGTTADATNPLRYCGEYYDAESGMIYLRNRYYDPSIGRFITEDPVQDGMNWYAYCGNNPVNYVDPSGESATAFIVGCTVVSALVSGGAQMAINYATGQSLFNDVGKAVISGATSGLVYGVTLNFGTAQTAGKYAAIAGTLITTGMNVVDGIKRNESAGNIAIGAIGDVAGGFVGYKIAGAVVKNNINSGWFKPQTLTSFFTKSYGKKIIKQTIAEGVITAATVSMYENGKRNIQGIQQLVGVDADGIYGPKTEAAVKKFQQNLISGGYLPSGEDDGIWGEKTDAAFRNYVKDNVMFVSVY